MDGGGVLCGLELPTTGSFGQCCYKTFVLKEVKSPSRVENWPFEQEIR
jgi:hypothetical protein